MTKPIKGYEGKYSVDEEGNVYNIKRKKKLSKITMESGYVYVHLFDGKRKNGRCHRLHRIVAEAFLPNPNGYEQVNHINGNKTDNSASNLEWCSFQQNMDHSIRTGLRKCIGEDNPSAKLTWESVKEIRAEYKRNSISNGAVALSRKYGVTDVMIGKIVRNECWVDNNYHPERSIHREA